MFTAEASLAVRPFAGKREVQGKSYRTRVVKYVLSAIRIVDGGANYDLSMQMEYCGRSVEFDTSFYLSVLDLMQSGWQSFDVINQRISVECTKFAHLVEGGEICWTI